MVVNVIGCEGLPSNGITECCRWLQMSWNDLERHPGLLEKVSSTVCHGKFELAEKDSGAHLGSVDHFADGKTEAQRGEGPRLMKLTRAGTGRCRFGIWAWGLRGTN